MRVTEEFAVRKGMWRSGVEPDLCIRKITLRDVEDRLERLSLQVKRSVRKLLETHGQDS